MSIQGAPQPFSDSDGNTILTAVKAIVPTILNALQEIVVKKPAFDGLPVSGIGALVKEDLINLNASTTDFEEALISAAPVRHTCYRSLFLVLTFLAVRSKAFS